MKFASKMVITKIIGGLGNQMFQYAAGRSLALHHNTDLLLDISSFNRDDLRNFELSVFKNNFAIAKPDKIKEITDRSFAGKVRDKFLPARFRKIYKEPFFHYDKNFFKAAPNAYIKGYWQSEKYFAHVGTAIRNDLAIKPELIEGVKHFGQHLITAPSVGVHIRRTDYTSAHTKQYHGIIEKDYYTKAIELMSAKQNNARFYFFSDNINWVKENFNIAGATFVSNEITKNHIEDLYLMSQCSHNIIANSSFSWWGAWLNNNPDKIVIAPKKWFNKGPKDTYDLYPDNWIIL